ncbi:HNH endonuclease [Pontiellaceae bacterium B1224]|nr:HNH endonuclease [Pontiellaceae bacterium B1224]
MRWRWDQGRLAYFNFGNIVTIAKVLHSLDGADLSGSDSFFRDALCNATGLPFAPNNYKVWRNYSRVFQCCMLATRIDGKLVVTDLCRDIARSPFYDPDQYFTFVFRRFALPYPAFQDYEHDAEPVYPFVAIFKYLSAKALSGDIPKASLEEVFTKVIGNRCSGLEPVEHYLTLPSVKNAPSGDEWRQVREMMSFMGQSAYCKWISGELFMEVNAETCIQNIMPELFTARRHNRVEEFLRITSETQFLKYNAFIQTAPIAYENVNIREGRRQVRLHRRIERSPKLRSIYFNQHPEIICDMCSLEPCNVYMWTNNLLELHHLLPLSSTITVTAGGTSLADLVPLCPTCHKSVHTFYRQKLQEYRIVDFESREMASDFYLQAKHQLNT